MAEPGAAPPPGVHGVAPPVDPRHEQLLLLRQNLAQMQAVGAPAAVVTPVAQQVAGLEEALARLRDPMRLTEEDLANPMFDENAAGRQVGAVHYVGKGFKKLGIGGGGGPRVPARRPGAERRLGRGGRLGRPRVFFRPRASCGAWLAEYITATDHSRQKFPHDRV